MRRDIDLRKLLLQIWLLYLIGSGFLVAYLENTGHVCFAFRIAFIDLLLILPTLFFFSWSDWRHGFAEKRTREKKAFGFEFSTAQVEKRIKFRAVIKGIFGLVIAWAIFRFQLWQLWSMC